MYERHNQLFFFNGGRSISRNMASLNMLVPDMINLLHFEFDQCHVNTWN